MKLDLDDLYIRIIPNLKVNEMIAPCENGYSVYILSPRFFIGNF